MSRPPCRGCASARSAGPRDTPPDTPTYYEMIYRAGYPTEVYRHEAGSRKSDAAFAHWRDVRAAAFENEAVLDVEFPDGLVLRVRFVTPGKFTLFQGSSPDHPPDRRAGFYLEKTGRAKEATFTTEFAPSPSK